MNDEMITEPERKIPVVRNVDIVVIGGSQSGVAAAVSAKRTNKDLKVLVVEETGYLGGQSVGGLVVHYEFREYTNNKGQVIAKGIGKEMIERIVKKGHSDPLYTEWLEGKGPPFKGVDDERAHGDIPLDVNDIELVLIEMCEEAGVEVLLHSKAVSPLPLETSTGFPASRGVIVETSGGRMAIKSKMVIDCSANALMAWWIGGENAVLIPESQAMSMQAYVWIENVDLEQFVEGAWEQKAFQVLYPRTKEQMIEHVHQGKTIITRGWADVIDEALENEPELAEAYEKTGAIPQIYFWLKTVKTRKIEVGGKVKYIGTFAIEGPQFFNSQIDPFIITQAEIGQKKAAHIQARMHRYLPGWQESFLDRTVSKIGFRQTRIPVGLYALTAADVRKHARFDDVIGRHTGHDIGRDNPEAEFGYDIPYRCLVPAEIDGLLSGARAVSVEGDENDKRLTALNAHRGISSTIIVSQACGTAAALCIEQGIEPRDLDVKKLQDKLKKQDVVLEQPKN
ncbi:MAG: FAD-dependent oxidoreductase [Candidatus Hodarchaeota archaeon]